MKKEISTQEMMSFEKDSIIYTILFLLMLLTPMPLIHFFNWWGLIVYVPIAIVALYYAFRVEKHKKKHDIQTYKEINAFFEGVSLDEITSVRESAKRPYQKILLAIGSALLMLFIIGIYLLITKLF